MAHFDEIDAPKEEQVLSPIKLEFTPYIVEISSSSEKSCTGKSQENGEEATSSFKRSTSLEQFSDENLCKKPRLGAQAEGSHEKPGGSSHTESVGLANCATDGSFLNDAIEGRNLHNDDNAVNDAVGHDDLPDDFLEPLDSPLASSPPPGMHMEEPIDGLPSARDMAKLMFRQFWKAGDYDGAPSMEDLDLSNGMEHVRVHPKFLHSNATSHKWALGAVAELLDNSLDEAVNGATLVNVDMICNPRDERPMLMIEDDGGGMDPERMRQCMSLGYSAKSKVANTIGQYGNGFKTSTMRLGADVVVFSRHKGKNGSMPTQSIGLLSYTFLTATGQDDTIVPMVDYEVHPFGFRKLLRGTVGDWNRNLETILQWSPYDTEKALIDQLKRINGQGTIVIVYNLWEDEDGNLELDFDADPHDIQLRGANRDEKDNQMALKYPNCRHFFTHKYSLRSYASILYLRLPKKFRMVLRGKQVVHHKVVNDLMLIEQVKYKPVKVSVKSHRDAVTVVTLGFGKDAKEHIDVQGFNVYHKNRLIKPFWRVWNYPGIQGRGIFGVLEANFVEPAHDKQGFERTTVFARLEARLIEIQKSYWSKNCEKIGYVGNASKKKAPSKGEGSGDDPSFERPSYPRQARVSLSPSNAQKSTVTTSGVPEKDQVQAGQSGPSQSISSLGTKQSISVVPEKDPVQAGQSGPGQSISSLGTKQSISSLSTKALPIPNTEPICSVGAASHTPPVSGNMARVSSRQSLTELDMEVDGCAAVVNTTTASRPSRSREALVSLDIVEARPTAQTSRPSEAARRADGLKVTPYVRVTRSQAAIEEGRVQGVSNTSVRTVDTAQTCLAEVVLRNGDDSELQTACGLSDRQEMADKSTSSLMAYNAATSDEIAEMTSAAPESDSKDTQPITPILESEDHMLVCSNHEASEDDMPSFPDGNQGALVLRSDEPSGLQTSLAGDPTTLDTSRPALHVSLMSESLQDSNEALISPSSQCEAPESSQCTSKKAANNRLLTSTETQEGRPRLTRSMLQLQQSRAKAAQLNKTQQPVVDGSKDALCIARTAPEEGDTSVSTLVTTGAEDAVSLESINMLEEKLEVMKQRLGSLQVDLEQICNERDFLKGELEEERRRQTLVEEELKKKLQAVTSQERELEAANKLLRVCQR